jgi:CTP-dependent riboflavin kinase
VAPDQEVTIELRLEPDPVEVVGAVASGLRAASGFTALDWVSRQLAEVLGAPPHPGTFNLRMGGPDWDRLRARLQRERGVPIAPAPGFCPARCFRVVLGGRVRGAAVLPEVAGYPADKLEVVAAVAVRDALGVREGDAVTVRVELDSRNLD